VTLRERAAEYAALLAVGSEILNDTDGPVVAAFIHLLPEFLYKRGLFLERTARGQIVSDRPAWLIAGGLMRQRHQPITCVQCRRSWFDCDHGANTGAVVQPAFGYVHPLQRLVGRATA
jgi:hypothetical protein